MLSPAQRHKAKISALVVIALAGAAGNAPARPETGPEATEYNLLRAQLGEHMHQLSQIKSVERKIETKATMIDTYDAHVLGVLEASNDTGKAVQDEVFTTIMIWRLDIGDFGMALDMADYVIKHNLELPERYNRNAATLVGDMVADAAIKAQKLKQPFDWQIIARAIDMTDPAELNVNDIVRAKLQKALGLELIRLSETIDADADAPAGSKRAAQEQAFQCLQRAFDLHDNSGVQKERDRLAKLLAKPEAHAA